MGKISPYDCLRWSFYDFQQHVAKVKLPFPVGWSADDVADALLPYKTLRVSGAGELAEHRVVEH